MSPKRKAVVEEENAYDYALDNSEELASVGKQLKQAGKSKDVLVKLLKVQKVFQLPGVQLCLSSILTSSPELSVGLQYHL
jgi:hypothetical protein